MIKKGFISVIVMLAALVVSCEKEGRVVREDAFVNADGTEYHCDGQCGGTKGSENDPTINNTENGGGSITDPNQDPDYDGIVDPDEDEDFDKDGK